MAINAKNTPTFPFKQQILTTYRFDTLEKYSMEIRHIIFEYVLVQPDQMLLEIYQPKVLISMLEAQAPEEMSLFRASKTIYMEAFGIFYSRNRFVISSLDLQKILRPRVTREQQRLLRMVRSIRHLEVYICEEDCIDGVIEALEKGRDLRSIPLRADPKPWKRVPKFNKIREFTKPVGLDRVSKEVSTLHKISECDKNAWVDLLNTLQGILEVDGSGRN